MRNGPYELVIAPEGYPGKRYRGRYIYEHQLVWWQNTGQLVPEGYLIHHENENKRDNRFSNLKLESRADHTAHHGQRRPKLPPMKVRCGWCHVEFEMCRRHYWSRIKQTKSGHLFCCKSHQALYQHSDHKPV